MTRGKICSTAATSLRLESRPREKRMSEPPSLSSSPIALRTCDGDSEPAEQAEPLEAQMPSKSKAARSVMLSHPATVNDSVLLKLDGLEPRTCTPGIDAAKLASLDRSGSSCLRLKTAGLMKRSVASAKPATAARFSVPARRSFSWLPPKRIGSGKRGDLMKSAPAPFGPWNL